MPPSGVPPSGLPTSGSASSTSDSMWSEQTDGSRWAPLRHHWFYLRAQENYWIPFSLVDSAVLESALLNNSDTSLQVHHCKCALYMVDMIHCSLWLLCGVK